MPTATTTSSGNDRHASGSNSASPASIASMQHLFPLTMPFPNPLTDDDVIPSGDLALEQDLLLHSDDLRAWRAYITHVETSNIPVRDTIASKLSNEPIWNRPDAIWSAAQRTLVKFPQCYAVWLQYLLRRSSFIAGEPKGGIEAWKKKTLESARQALDAGPALLEQQEEEEWEWREGKALDGRVGHREWESLAATFERALMCLPKMPRLWLLYFSILTHPLAPVTLSRTHTRRTFDRALRTLPPSLHLRVWKPYLRWAESVGGETCLMIWRRYLRVDPSLTERYVGILLKQRQEVEEESAEQEEEEEDEEVNERKIRRSREASKLLLKLAKEAQDGTYTSPEGKSPYQLLIEWLELCEKHGDEIGLDHQEEQDLQNYGKASAEGAVAESSAASLAQRGAVIRASDLDALDAMPIPVDGILRALGINKFPDQAGRLWTGLATYWIQRGELEVAKGTFEEGISSVVTVRDFTQIFDAYAETSENVIGYLMEELGEEQEDEGEAEERRLKEQELDERMQNFELLMERRPFLINEVLLRRNPDDVQEWEKKIALQGNEDDKIVDVYNEATATINPRKATANYHQLWLNFAKFYEVGGSSEGEEGEADLDSARLVFERAVKVNFKRVDDLAEVWCEWAEMEVRAENYEAALRVMSRAASAPVKSSEIKHISYHDDALSAQKRLFKSTKLWSFYVDLEESIGTVEGAKRAYDRILELKIANAQIIVNYASFLEEHKYFEDAFRVYERGVEAFGYPIAFEIWNVYISKFVKRYGGSKIERARDLFEQALESCPSNFAKPLLLKYGALEEEHGLAKRALSIYERATQKVSDEDRFDMFTFYIAKAAANFGLAATRSIYERAIEVLPDKQTAEMCLRFAALERKLGEIDRARAIYAHASQFCDPRTRPDFWSEWNKFEIETGSEDTFREMLRIKRAVQAQFNTDVSYIAASAALSAAAGAAEAQGAAGEEDEEDDPMARAEAASRKRAGAATIGSAGGPVFVAATTTGQVRSEDQAKNKEQIGGDDDDDDLL
ncbi:spliceosome complex protein [Ceraceosorus bombacis]|uniref:Pre-mRNA-splicing factor SYF1 n=1 Tax=Ceraceosorus bombacis TaxID=401625 RepID=A0A0P1BK87_9BASI|nr:spliceosome complex protein [Ceraceosorus bombacis]